MAWPIVLVNCLKFTNLSDGLRKDHSCIVMAMVLVTYLTLFHISLATMFFVILSGLEL